MIYRITDYVHHFETTKTLEYKTCRRVTFPNSLNNQHRMQLVKGEDGQAFLGIWISIVQWMTAQSSPREGYLTDNTRADGIPLDLSDLSPIIIAPEPLIKLALERLSSPFVGWLEEIPVEVGPSDDQVTTINANQSPSIPLHSTPYHTIPLHSEEVRAAEPTKKKKWKRRLII